MGETNICIKCNKRKEISCFCKSQTRKNVCYECNLQRSRKYEEEHKEYRQEYYKKRNKRYRKENYIKIKLQQKEFRRINDKKIKEQKRISRQKIKQQVITMYGGKCAYCGISSIEFLTIDHINGRGLKERTQLNKRGGTEFYQFLAKQEVDKTRYQVLCQNCNWLKYRNASPRSLSRDAQCGYQLKLQVFMNYGGCCACCGESNLEILTIDHIYGGGIKHRQKVGSSGQVYREIRNEGFPKDKYQLLCRNCNCARSQYKCCPHKKGEGT